MATGDSRFTSSGYPVAQSRRSPLYRSLIGSRRVVDDLAFAVEIPLHYYSLHLHIRYIPYRVSIHYSRATPASAQLQRRIKASEAFKRKHYP